MNLGSADLCHNCTSQRCKSHTAMLASIAKEYEHSLHIHVLVLVLQWEGAMLVAKIMTQTSQSLLIGCLGEVLLLVLRMQTNMAI